MRGCRDDGIALQAVEELAGYWGAGYDGACSEDGRGRHQAAPSLRRPVMAGRGSAQP